MSSKTKIVLLYNDGDGPAGKFKLVTLSSSISNGSTESSSRDIFIPSGFLSNATPSTVWDFANGCLLVSTPTTTGVAMLLTLRAGNSVGVLEPLTTNNQTTVTANSVSIAYWQTAPYVAWINSEGWVEICTRAKDPAKLGPYVGRFVTSAALSGAAVKSNSSPRLIRISNNWLFAFTMNTSSPGNMEFSFIDALGLDTLVTTDLKDSKVMTYWNTYYTNASLSGEMTGWPAVVLTGSTSTNRKLHVFVTNKANELRYFYLKVGENGLPSSYPDNQIKVPAYGETRILENVKGPLSTVVYEDKIYVFYQVVSGGNALVTCSSRSIDGAEWSKPIELGLKVSQNDHFGGVSATVVQNLF